MECNGWEMLIHRREGEGPHPAMDLFGNVSRPSQSLMFAPMVAGDRVVGILSAQSYEPEAHSQQDLDLLSAMASQAALAIANARLHEATQKTLAMRESLNHIAKAIGDTFDLRQISHIVYEEICHLVCPAPVKGRVLKN